MKEKIFIETNFYSNKNKRSEIRCLIEPGVVPVSWNGLCQWWNPEGGLWFHCPYKNHRRPYHIVLTATLKGLQDPLNFNGYLEDLSKVRIITKEDKIKQKTQPK